MPSLYNLIQDESHDNTGVNKVEIFSNDPQVSCNGSGFCYYNNISLCVQWCKYAKECIGKEVYQKRIGKKDGEEQST